MLGDTNRDRLLGLVLVAVLCCRPVVADEIICIDIQSEGATLEYRSLSDNGSFGSVSIKLPQRVFWDEDAYRYVTGRPSASEEAFEFDRLQLIVKPADGGSGRLQMRLELETWNEADTVEQARSGTVNDAVVNAKVTLANHEGSVLLLRGYYWSEDEDKYEDDWEGGCVSHLTVEINPPGRPGKPRNEKGGAGEQEVGSSQSGTGPLRSQDPSGEYCSPAENECAVRLSTALARSGVDVSGSSRFGRTHRHGDGTVIQMGARPLADYLWATLGRPQIMDHPTGWRKEDFEGRSGIIYFVHPLRPDESGVVPGGRDGDIGHIDVLHDQKTGSGFYRDRKVWFWEYRNGTYGG